MDSVRLTELVVSLSKLTMLPPSLAVISSEGNISPSIKQAFNRLQCYTFLQNENIVKCYIETFKYSCFGTNPACRNTNFPTLIKSMKRWISYFILIILCDFVTYRLVNLTLRELIQDG